MVKKTTQIRRKKATKTPLPQERPVRLPDGYHGPAYRLDENRTLFVGRRYDILTHWGTLFLRDTSRHPELYTTATMPVVDNKQTAIAHLINYATTKGLVRVQ